MIRWNKQKDMNVVQSFHFYEGVEGNNEVSVNRSSGAYIFRPKETSARNFVYTGSYEIYKGITCRIYSVHVKMHFLY